MNFTHAQISELLLEIANSENGTNLLMQLTLETFMKSERSLHQKENPTDYANGFRTRTASGLGKELVLKVPRTRSGTFYPALLGVLRDEDEETYVIYLIGKGDKEIEVFIKKSLINFELNELIEKEYKFICETSSGKQMDGSQIYRMLKSIYNKLNIKANVHDLRHTFAKSLSYKNVDITVIKELLGHSSIQTTAIYTNPSRKRIKSAVIEVF